MFFFFKQKTAYEMRISDWSSDVCSSDLVAVEIPPALEAEAFVNVDFRRPSGGGDQHEGGQGTAPVGKFGGEFILAVADLDRAGVGAVENEIGRAACRDRVCQHVEIQVDDITLKKK